MSDRIRLMVEAAPKRVFVAALHWPGWVRGGKDEGLAVEALLAAAPRFAAVTAEAGLAFDPDSLDLDVVERLPGGSGTEFGVPSAIAEADRVPVDAAEAARLAAIVEAAWVVFDRVAAAAPEELRKGPRGGGRDRTKIVGHVNEADEAYAREIGLASRPNEVPALRAAMLEVLRTPSDGSPLAGRRWTQRYAARRIAWHALDHAWEIEDRTER
ncbi:MAG: hypothetical protein AB1627_05705 [Chloroflexota bacterium]